jgi:hypothetical protein
MTRDERRTVRTGLTPRLILLALFVVLLEDRASRGRPRADVLAAALELAEEEDVVEELGHLGRLRARLLDERVGVLSGEGGGLEEGEDARERRPELVRNGCRERGAKLLELAGRGQRGVVAGRGRGLSRHDRRRWPRSSSSRTTR